MSEETKIALWNEMTKKIEQKTKEYFKKADLNGDGAISKSEWLKCEEMYSNAKKEKFSKQSKLEEFHAFDVNKDGQLSEEELVNGTLNLLKEIENNLSLLSEEEIKQFGAMIFTQMDDYINAVHE
eukprot:gene10034-2353_t